MGVVRGKILVAAAVAITASLFAATFAYEYLESEGWYVQRVETCDTKSQYTALTVDGSGKIHLAYHGMDDRKWVVKHAVRTDGDWEVSSVGPASDRIYDLRLSVDDDSIVHVSWCDSLLGFAYARSSPDGFVTARVSVDDFYGGRVAIDSTGNVHGLCSILRWNSTDRPGHWDRELQHWTISSGEWTLAKILDLPDNSSSPGVVALLTREDDDPLAVVSYTPDFTDTRCFARAVLTESALEYEDPFIFGNDLYIYDAELDSQGMIHLLTSTYEPMAMYYHWYQDQDHWAHVPIDWHGDSYYAGADLVIDDDDTVYAAYFQEYYALDFSSLKVAERTDDGWDFTTCECASGFGYDRPALVIGDDGDYHMAHFEFDGKNKNILEYVNNDDGEVLVEELKDAGMWTALAAVVGWPTVFAGITWNRRRNERRERLEKLGLFEGSPRKRN
jgi:hypothetical protein